MSVLNLLPGAIGQQRPQILSAEISSLKPSPQTFSDPMWVVFPKWSTEVSFPITDWNADHGVTLPPAGNAATIVIDDDDNMRCVWWSGTTQLTGAQAGSAVVLAGGSAVVSNSSVTAVSRILLTGNVDGGTPGWLRVSARVPGISFTITSSSSSDTSTVAYQIESG